MRHTGIWIDTRQAKLLDWDGRKIGWRIIYSGAERKPKIKGETSKRTQQKGIGFDYASAQEAKFREALKKFFCAVIEAVTTSDSLYLLGPAEAKVLLEKELKKTATLKSRVLRVEACDSLTDNQLAEKVLNFFKNRKMVYKTKK